MAIIQRPMTLEEFLELPEQQPALEYQDGKVTRKVSPKGQHSWLQFVLAELFNRFARPGKLALAFPELRTTFSGASRVPYVSVYRWERIPLTPDDEVADDFTEPPDTAIEILSPRQSVTALVRRCLRFVEEGVTIALLVDPKDRSVIRFGRNGSARALHGSDPIDLSEVLPGFELTAHELFESLRLR